MGFVKAADWTYSKCKIMDTDCHLVVTLVRLSTLLGEGKSRGYRLTWNVSNSQPDYKVFRGHSD